MKLNKVIFVVIALVACVFINISGKLMTEEILAIGLFIYFLLNFIDSIGKTYNMIDIPILLALFQCMLMPTIVYRVYNDNPLVIALKYDMSVTANVYFGFMFPAICSMIIGLKLPEWFLPDYSIRFNKAVNASKKYLVGNGNIGVLLIIVGFVTGFMQIFIPGDFKYIAYLFGKLLYVGVIYTLFSDSKQRKLYLIIGLVAILAQSITQALFGELIYILALGVMLVFLGKKVKNSLKYSIAIVGFLFVLILQSIKSDYRDVAWLGKGEPDQGNTEAFFSLIVNRITNPGRFFDWTLMFPTVNRFNQGMIVGKVLVYVPNQAPFANGATIFTALAASFIPRVIWQDKPMSGGHFNMKRFTGYEIVGYSMNISPMGEAYGNFGKDGGIVFMLFYGLFFSVAIFLMLRISRKRPTLILWFPILFLNSLQIETDILMCINSLIKNCIFIWFCYWAADRFLRLKL